MKTLVQEVKEVQEAATKAANDVAEVHNNYNMGFITKNEMLNQLLAVTSAYHTITREYENIVEIKAVIAYLEMTGK